MKTTLLESLTESPEAEFRDLLECANDLIIILAPDARFLYSNQAFQSALGYSAPELRALDGISDLLQPSCPLKCQTLFQDLLKHAQPQSFEVEFVTRDGRRIVLEGNCQRSSKHPGNIHAIFRDVTEHQRAQEALRKSEEKYRNLIEQAPDAIFVASPDLHVIDVNARASELTGYTRDEILQMLTTDFIPPEDIRATPFRMKELREGKAVLSERRVRRKNGTLFPVEIHARILSDGTQQGIVRDMTERKQSERAVRESEERFRSFIEHSHDAIALFNAAGAVLYASPSTTNVLGYLPQELVGRSAIEFVRNDCRAGVAERLTESLRRPGVGIPSEAYIKHKDGRWRFLEGIFTNLLDDPSVGAIVNNYRDITERKLAESALRNKEHLLSESQRIAKIGSWLFDPTGQTTTWSEEMYRIYGVTPENFTNEGESFLDLIHPDDHSSLRAWSAACLAGEKPPPTEFRAVLPDGSIRFIRAQGELNCDHEGGQSYLTGTAQDITERRRSEALVNGQKQVLEMIARGAPLSATLNKLVEVIEAQSPEMLCSILLLDADGIHVRHGAAPSLAASFNQAIDGVVIGPQVGSCGTAMFRREAVMVADVQTDPLWQDYRSLAGEHGLRACWSAPIFDAQKKILGTFAIYYRQPGLPTDQHRRLIDIATQTAAIAISRQQSEAALRESEGRYRALVEWSPDAISVHRDGKLLFVNPAAVRMFGARSADDLIGKSIVDLVHPDFNHVALARMASETRRGSVPMIEARFIKLDGTAIDVEIQGTAIIYDGEPAHHDTMRDITERKKAEAALRTSGEQLRALSARLQSAREEEGTRIAREIHDELGGALTGLKWDLEGIDKVLSSTADGDILAAQRDRIVNMTGLVESTINTVRRIASELRPGVLDDLGLVAAIEWQAQQFQSRTGIQCECVAQTDVLDLTRECATAVFRILQEILTNVIRHAQATRVDIELRAQDGELELRVVDNGRGITAAEMHNTSSLGLLGMQERALLVGGKVTISREAQLGTTVLARLPIG
jgi:PAS domain S-box-containing protein